MSTLSSLLPEIIADGLSPEWLVIETIPRHELLDYSFHELFQPSGYSELSAEASQSPMDTVNTQQTSPLGEPSQTRPKLLLTVDTQWADTVLDPSLDPRLFNQSSFHGQDVIESAQGPLNGTPRDFTLGGEWSTSQGGNWKVQQPFGQYERQYSPSQGGNWQSQEPLGHLEVECTSLNTLISFSPFSSSDDVLRRQINLKLEFLVTPSRHATSLTDDMEY